jgi:hypothetical protein
MAPVAVRVVRNVHSATVGLVIGVVHVGSWFSEPVWRTGVGRGWSTLPDRTVSAVALRSGIGTFSRRDCDS